MSDILKPIIENYTTKLANELSRIRWDILTPKYKNFLQQIPLSLYREKLQSIKTVEFDLSGKYRSFHLSLIYHLYWKKKFIKITNTDQIPQRLRNLKQIADFILSNGQRKIELFKILGQFGFNTEEDFTKWFYYKQWSNATPREFIIIEEEFVDEGNFLTFEDFWKEYKMNVDIDHFIQQHKNFINLDSIREQIREEIGKNQLLFAELKEEEINTGKFEEIIKGYTLVGLKARIYRTWVSLLTQLDLVYTWNKNITEFKMDSDVVLDIKGIDVYGVVDGEPIGIQIKKRSRRHEALKIVEGETPIKTVNIPYDLNFESDEFLRDKLEKFDNGFVVFNQNYITHIYNQIKSNL
jgi:hypothetical protein